MSVTSPISTALSPASTSRRGLAFGVVLAIALGLLSAGFAASAQAADTCANAAVRIQTGSTGLPDCRAYEMVSSPYKEGFPVTPGGFTDGGVVSYKLRGSIAGDMHGSSDNLYHGVRSAAGWLTTPMGPPATIYNTSLGSQLALPVAFEAPDLRGSLWSMYRRDESVSAGIWLRGPDGAFTRVGDRAALGLRGASDDLSHLVVSEGVAGGAAQTALYEYVGTGNVGAPRAVGVNNAGQATPGETCSRDVSSDGRVIVFSSGCNGGTEVVWARVGGSATVLVSGSECTRSASATGGLCNGLSAASYEGAALDGSRVFFTTSQQLVNGDVDASNDLYACDIPAGVPAPAGSANGCTTLTEVSGAANDAQVQNVVAVSEDGSRVYFVASGVLADNLGVGDAGALEGAANLYVWARDGAHPAGQTTYVARLAVGNDFVRTQMTPDGRYLLLRTANGLVTSGTGADTIDGITDVYRYDAVTHTIVRVSTSVAGGGGNGPFDVSIPEASAMSADGSTVVFESAEALSLSDANGVPDAYSWRDGQVSLISSGGGSALGVSASGRDIFFTTDAPVLAADRDIIRDIYDARLGGGFEPAQVPPRCSGEQCQGLASRAPGLAVPPAAVPGGGALPDVGPVFSVQRVSAAQRKAFAAKGKISLTVTANVPGTVSARATASVDGRSTMVGSARRTLTVPGRVAVALTLSKRSRARLASRGRLTVRVTVSHSKVALDRAVTLRLVRTKAKRSAKHASARRSASSVGEERS